MTSDVFTTDATSAVEVELVVNGNSSGNVSVAPGTTIKDFVTEQAKQAGIRTFSVYIDGEKLDTTESSNPVAHDSKIEIVAKDARG